MDGILNINKSPGMTSFAVVARVKRLTGERHCGHAGTLDPLATGVLPVCLGKATRVIEYLFDETKTYRAEVRLGLITDTYDTTGKTLQETDSGPVSREMVEVVLPRFRGFISQVPPMFSALKHHGQPLYKLARAGQEVDRESRPAHIYRLDLTGWQMPVLTLEVECSKGTYIRSLAHDIGQALGCGAAMQNLARLRVGGFKIEDALTLEQLEILKQENRLDGRILPADYALQNFPALIVSHEQQCLLVHGNPLPASSVPESVLARVYNLEGDFVGMARYVAESNHWHPEKIFLNNCCQQTLTEAADITPPDIEG